MKAFEGMGMKGSVWIVGVLWFVAGQVFAQDLEFKGLLLGRATTTVQVVEHLAVCGQAETSCSDSLRSIADLMKITCGADSDGTQICNGKTTIAGSLADANTVIGSDGRLQRIFMTFSSDSYDVVHDALLKKYGKPFSVKMYPVQNGFGAQFVQVDTVWLRADGLKLQLSRYGANIGESVAYFGTKADESLLKSTGDSKDL